MEKVIKTETGHVILTYFQSCHGPKTDDKGKIVEGQIFQPRNKLDELTIYGVEAASGQTIRMRMSVQDFFWIKQAYEQIRDEAYPALDYDQYCVEFCC